MSAPEFSLRTTRPLRLDVIAEWLGVAVKTVRRLIDRGKLRSVKIGGLSEWSSCAILKPICQKPKNGEDRANV